MGSECPLFALNDFCTDTCAVMFGCNIGVATRLEELFKNLNGRKCANHEGALAAAHGVAAVPCLKSTYMPTLEMMGVQNDALPPVTSVINVCD